MFEDSLKVILENEGGFVDDPDDAGGRTNFGITQSVYDPSGVKDVKNITPEEVSAIYLISYYKPSGAEMLDLAGYPELSLQVFDCAVNCGVGTAVKMLQRMVGANVDGVFGSVTLMQTKTFADTKDHTLNYLYQRERAKYYNRLVVQKPNQLKFITSWLSRTFTL